jgi:hypothetical protein
MIRKNGVKMFCTLRCKGEWLGPVAHRTCSVPRTILFYPEDDGSILVRNVSELASHCAESY